MTYKAGQEIDAYCTKCRMDLLHRIVAVASGKPAKVECRTCGGIHLYRAPKSGPRAGAASATAASSGDSYQARTGAPAAKPATSAASRSAARAAPAPKVDESAPLVPPDSAHIFIYKMTEKYAPTTWIQHKTFGIGRVEREVGPGKIEVRFDGGARVLVHDVQPS